MAYLTTEAVYLVSQSQFFTCKINNFSLRFDLNRMTVNSALESMRFYTQNLILVCIDNALSIFLELFDANTIEIWNFNTFNRSEW